MMKQNYNNKAKYRSAWLALVLLMITALPITAQNVGDRFQVDGYWYQVVDATAKTVKVTWANSNAATEQATQQELANATAKLPDQWKGYNGTPKVTLVEEFITDKPFDSKNSEADTKHEIPVVVIPETVKYNNKDWTVVAIGSYAFINERGIDNVELPESIEAIEDAAFYQCSVTMINFPANLKYIGWRAFYKTNLAPYSEIVLKGNKQKKYKYSKNFQPIKILGATAIGPQAFEGSFSKSKFECSNITFVGYQAFKGDKFDITTPIPATAKIGEAINDPKITDMYKNLPAGTDQRSGVESFAEYSYDLISSRYKEPVVPTLAEGPTTIPAGMFEKAFIEKDNFFIPLSVTTIEERAFANASIKSFNELSAVKKIGARAFENGKLTGDFVVLDNVEEIGNEAFKGNELLTGFTLKGSTNCTVGAGFLEGCTNVEYLDLRDVNSTVVKNNLKNLSREANSNTITAGLPTHTLVYLPKVSDISIAAGQDVNFVKSDGICTKLVLVDGTDYEFPYAITASEVVYQRDLPSLSHFIEGKNCFTIFLPYAVKLPKGIRAYNLDYLNKKGNTETYMFKSIPDKDKDILKANTPYLLRITDGKTHTSDEFEAASSPVTIAASGTKLPKSKLLKPQCFVKAESDQSYAFYGNTEKTSIYWYSDGNIGGETKKELCPWVLNVDYPGKDVWRQYSTKNEAFVPPFRGFIMSIPGTSGAKQFVVLSEGETTGINDVTTDADAQQGAQRIYTIDGRYVGTDFDSLPSGMYIMKGKKTLKTK